MLTQSSWARRFMTVMAILVLGLAFPATARAQSGDQLTIGQDVVVASGETVDGNVIVFGGELEVEEGGAVTGDVTAVFGVVTIDGEVGGDVFVSGTLRLGPTADVGGDVTAVGDLEVDEQAVVAGALNNAATGTRSVSLPRPVDARAQFAVKLAAIAVATLVAMIFAALTVAVAPNAVSRVRHAMGSRPGTTLATGCLAWILFLPLLVAVGLTIVGLVILPLLYAVALLVGWVALGDMVGSRLVGGRRLMVRAVLGTLVLALLFEAGTNANLPVALATALLWVLVSAWPLGASVHTAIGTRDWPSRGPTPAGPALPSAPEGQTPGSPAGPTPSVAPPPGTLERPTPPAALPPAPGQTSDGGVTPPLEPPALYEPPIGSWLEPPASEESVAEEPGDAADDGAASPAMPGTTPAMPEVQAESDLHRVPGITPVYARLLADAGIRDLSTLAASSPEEVAAIASAPGVLPVPVQTSAAWIDAAAELTGLRR